MSQVVETKAEIDAEVGPDEKSEDAGLNQNQPSPGDLGVEAAAAGDIEKQEPVRDVVQEAIVAAQQQLQANQEHRQESGEVRMVTLVQWSAFTPDQLHGVLESGLHPTLVVPLQQEEVDPKVYGEHMEIIQKFTKAEIVPEIRVGSSLEKSVSHICAVITPYISNRSDELIKFSEVTPSEATDLIASGFYVLSSYRTFCPVAYVDEGQVVEDLDSPVVFNETVFFVQSKNLSKFRRDPLRYLCHPVPYIRPLCVPRCVVIGTPYGGVSTHTKMLVESTGAVHLTASACVNWLLTKRDGTDDLKRRHCQLAHDSLSALTATEEDVAGSKLDDSFVAQAIHRRVRAVDCRTRGWILEGFPMTENQSRLLMEAGVEPLKVFVVTVSLEEASASRRQQKRAAYMTTESLKKPATPAASAHDSGRADSFSDSDDDAHSLKLAAKENTQEQVKKEGLDWGDIETRVLRPPELTQRSFNMHWEKVVADLNRVRVFYAEVCVVCTYTYSKGIVILYLCRDLLYF